MSPKISVAFIFYNDAKYLHDSIRSILNQSFQDFELIMIDNGSTDNSFEVANNYAVQDNRIKILRSDKNYFGGGINFRKLLAEARGEYIKLFCADDILMENCLEKQVNLLEQNPQYLACFTNLKMVDENANDLNKEIKCVIKKDRFEYLNHIFNSGSPFTFPSAFIRKSSLDNSMLDMRLIHFFDVKLWVEILKKGEVFVIEESLVKYRIRDNEGNVSNIASSQERMKAYIFENHLFYEEFFKINDFDLFKRIFPESQKYLDKIDKNLDLDLLPFIAAMLLYNNEKFNMFYFGFRKNISLLKMFNLMNNEELFEKVEKKLEISYQKIRELSNNFLDGAEILHIGTPVNPIKKFFFGFFIKRKRRHFRRMLITKLKPI